VKFSAGVVIFFGFLVWPAYKDWKERTRKLRIAAADLGLTYHDGKFRPEPSLLQSRLLRRGFRRQFGPAITGEYEGVEILLFDYRYVRSEASDSVDRSYLHTVVVFSAPEIEIPDFVMVREGFGDRIFKRLFGNRDIEFEGDSAFSKRYLLAGPIQKAVRDLFGSELRAAFIRTEKKWAAEAMENRLILFPDDQSDERVKAEDLANYVQEAWAIFEVIRKGRDRS